MKKQNKPMNSDRVLYLKSLISKQREVIDLFVENSHIVAVLDSGLRVKIHV